jgi:hypothetical protein
MWESPMLKAVVDAGVAVPVFFAIVVVGMELTTADFRRIDCQLSGLVLSRSNPRKNRCFGS